MTQKYMMATTAIHQLGDISSETPDLCRVYDEDEENYIGAWVAGLGFFNVKFPKSTTRELTEEEHKEFGRKHLVMSGMDLGKLDTREV